MHASVHELLSLRDDVVVDDSIATHVRACEECGAELQRLRTVTSELRALPGRWTAPDSWGRIETALALNAFEPMVPVTPAARTRKPGWAIPLAAAAAVTITVAALTWQGEPETQIPVFTAQQPSFEFQEPVQPVAQEQTEADITEAGPLDLPAQSRKLEQMLASLPAEPAVTRAGTALTLAELHDRIRWVDYRLARGDEEGLESQQSEVLWRERVDLLNSLVAVRYAQTRTSF